MQILKATPFAERITECLMKQGIIEEQRKELYTFGIRQMTDMILNIVTVICIGIWFRMLPELVLFTLAYVSIRCYAGGYHARTRMLCYFCSLVMFLAALPIIYILTGNSIISLAITAITSVIIFILAPVEHHNKPLRENEKKVYRQRARIFTGGELLIAVIAHLIKVPMISAAVAAAFMMLCIMLLAGRGHK